MINIFLILVYAVVIWAVGMQDWKLTLIVPFALLVSFINFKLIDKVGKVWHEVQLSGLVIAFVILIITKVIKWDEIMLLISLYYVTFETSLNAFRKLPLNYIGKTSTIDKLIRKVFKKEAMLNQMSTLGKFILLFIGIAIYFTGK